MGILTLDIAPQKRIIKVQMSLSGKTVKHHKILSMAVYIIIGSSERGLVNIGHLSHLSQNSL